MAYFPTQCALLHGATGTKMCGVAASVTELWMNKVAHDMWVTMFPQSLRVTIKIQAPDHHDVNTRTTHYRLK